MIDACTAVLMAGGKSRRMGRDKATLRLGETTLLDGVARVVAPLFAQLLVSVGAPRADLDWPQVCDAYADAGPLAGLCAALTQAATPWIFVVATDMPFVKPALIELLAARRAGVDAVVPRVHGHPQPLAAFYSQRCLAPFAALLDAGERGDGGDRGARRSLRAALERVAVAYVDEAELLAADAGLDSFFDLDTPQDLARWLELGDAA